MSGIKSVASYQTLSWKVHIPHTLHKRVGNNINKQSIKKEMKYG